MADIIYIDAGHEYEAVLLDAQLYWNLLNPGGYIIFDDYSWPGVIKAVDEFFSDKPDIMRSIKDSQAMFCKPKS